MRVPTIKFLKNRAAIEVKNGTNLMQGLLDHGIPVASSCRGDAVCGKCWVKVLQGGANLSNVNGDEIRLQTINKLPPNARISCQVEVHGDITLDTPYW